MASDNNKQFRRTYELTIGDPQAKGVFINGDEENNEGLAINFSITKNIDNSKDNDRCSISITNLSEDSINYIKEKSSAVILKVGYNGDNKLLFQGIVQELETDDRTGNVDRVTSLRCVPADAFIYNSNVSKTFPENTTPRQIINYLIGNSQSLSRASFNSDNIDVSFPFGYSIEGSTQQVLKELARDFKFDWRISSDKLYISDPDKYEKPNSVERAFLFTPNTGMIGRPIFVTGDGRDVEDSENRRKGVKFKSLINPLVRPGSAVKVQDTALKGVYRVNSVEYRGDWRGNSWEATYTCSKLNTR